MKSPGLWKMQLVEESMTFEFPICNQWPLPPSIEPRSWDMRLRTELLDSWRKPWYTVVDGIWDAGPQQPAIMYHATQKNSLMEFTNCWTHGTSIKKYLPTRRWINGFRNTTHLIRSATSATFWYTSSGSKSNASLTFPCKFTNYHSVLLLWESMIWDFVTNSFASIQSLAHFNGPFRFLDFPCEIRDEIYDQLLSVDHHVSPKVMASDRVPTNSQSCYDDVTCVCKGLPQPQIRQEAAERYYSGNSFGCRTVCGHTTYIPHSKPSSNICRLHGPPLVQSLCSHARLWCLSRAYLPWKFVLVGNHWKFWKTGALWMELKLWVSSWINFNVRFTPYRRSKCLEFCCPIRKVSGFSGWMSLSKTFTAGTVTSISNEIAFR